MFLKEAPGASTNQSAKSRVTTTAKNVGKKVDGRHSAKINLPSTSLCNPCIFFQLQVQIDRYLGQEKELRIVIFFSITMDFLQLQALIVYVRWNVHCSNDANGSWEVESVYIADVRRFGVLGRYIYRLSYEPSDVSLGFSDPFRNYPIKVDSFLNILIINNFLFPFKIRRI